MSNLTANVNVVEEVAPYEKMTDDEIKARLFTYSVKVSHRADRKKLIEQLREVEGA